MAPPPLTLCFLGDDLQAATDFAALAVGREIHLVPAGDTLELLFVADDRCDLIVVHGNPAGSSAESVVREVRSDTRLRLVPLVVILERADADATCRLYTAGADQVLVPPLAADLLAAVVSGLAQRWAPAREMVLQLSSLANDRDGANALVGQVLPASAVAELRATGRVQPRKHQGIGIIFADMVGFTAYCDHHDADAVVAMLDQVLGTMEEVAANHGVDKIKTLGDAFMGAAGLFSAVRNPERTCIDCGLAIIERCRALTGNPCDVRVGVNVGNVVSGILGRDTWHYDIWGDAVNVAARLQSKVRAGTVGVTASVWEDVGGLYEGTSLGPIEMKGKGEVEIVAIAGRKPPVTMRLARKPPQF